MMEPSVDEFLDELLGDVKVERGRSQKHPVPPAIAGTSQHNQVEALEKCLVDSDALSSSLINLESQLTQRLAVNRETQQGLQERIEKVLGLAKDDANKQREVNRRRRFAIPYFVDDKGMSPVEIKKPQREGNIIKSSKIFKRRWSLKLEAALKTAMRNSILTREKLRLNTTRMYIRDKLKTATSSDERKEMLTKLEEMEREVDELYKLPDDELFERRIDVVQWSYVSNALMDKKTATQCESYWKYVLSPQVNREEWSSEETRTLLEVISHLGKYDWDLVADRLGTGRTAVQCLKKYHEVTMPCVWAPPLDKKLSHLVAINRRGRKIDWLQVHREFPQPFSQKQLYRRWTRRLNPDIKKGPFTPAEDSLLMAYIQKYGPHFRLIAALMPGRSSMQIRLRYKNTLHKDIVYGSWTLKEDKLILKGIEENGMDLKNVAKNLPGRSVACIRHRYKRIKKYMEKFPGFPVADLPLPRRKQKMPVAKTVSQESTVSSLHVKIKKETSVVRRQLGQFQRRLKRKVDGIRIPAVEPGQKALDDFFKQLPAQMIRRAPRKKNYNNEKKSVLCKMMSFYAELLGMEFDIPDFPQLDGSHGRIREDLNRSQLEHLRVKSEPLLGMTVASSGTVTSHYLPFDAEAMVGLSGLLKVTQKLNESSATHEAIGQVSSAGKEQEARFLRHMKSLFTLPYVMKDRRPEEPVHDAFETIWIDCGEDTSFLAEPAGESEKPRKRKRYVRKPGTSASKRLKAIWRERKAKESVEVVQEETESAEPPSKKRKYVKSGKYSVHAEPAVERQLRPRSGHFMK